MARANIATKDIVADSVTFTFSDGKQLVCMLPKLSPEIQTRLALHGIVGKVGDSYAGEKNVQAARALASSVWARLSEGDWTRASTGGGGRISDLAQALSRVTGQPLDACVEKLAEMEKSDKTGLRKHVKIASALADITAERAAERAAVADTGDDSALPTFDPS